MADDQTQTRRSVRATCPGKVILMGDHAAVYGRPAVVATVGLMTEAIVQPGVPGRVTAELVNLGREWSWSPESILERTETAQESWRDYAESPSAAGLQRLLGEADAERLAVLSLGEASQAAGREPAGVHLSVFSELPMGAGMGSSASVASAIIAGMFESWGMTASAGRVAAAALEVERRQHGFPSGVDHQTVIQGGVVWALPGRERGRVEVEPLRCDSWPRPLLIDTGSPDEGTAEVVETVRRRTGGDGYDGWDRMDDATREFRAALEAGADPRPPVRAYQRQLERLGVVPQAVADWIRSWEDGGGVAKVSGAGATRGDRAGCLLAYPPDRDWQVAGLQLADGWILRDAAIGGPGLSVDRN